VSVEVVVVVVVVVATLGDVDVTPALPTPARDVVVAALPAVLAVAVLPVGATAVLASVLAVAVLPAGVAVVAALRVCAFAAIAIPPIKNSPIKNFFMNLLHYETLNALHLKFKLHNPLTRL
jgi:hypothetical protein